MRALHGSCGCSLAAWGRMRQGSSNRSWPAHTCSARLRRLRRDGTREAVAVLDADRDSFLSRLAPSPESHGWVVVASGISLASIRYSWQGPLAGCVRPRPERARMGATYTGPAA